MAATGHRVWVWQCRRCGRRVIQPDRQLAWALVSLHRRVIHPQSTGGRWQVWAVVPGRRAALRDPKSPPLWVIRGGREDA